MATEPLTLTSLQQQITDLQTRLAVVDGQGLVNQTGLLANLQSQINGVKKTLGNVNMGYQATLRQWTDTFTKFQQAVNTALGLPH